MRKIAIIIGVVLVLVLVAGAFFYKGMQDVKDAISSDSAATEHAWIEVVTPVVVGVLGGVGQSLELKTGDELFPGTKLSTSKTGRAIIHFPDGSFATLDPESALVIEEGSYDPSRDSLAVRLVLRAGTVWSKVLTFSDDESSWSVETSHAVATVRGTAFGVSADINETKVLGIENKVAVGLKTETGEEIKTETEISPDTQVRIPKKDLNAMVKGEIALKTEVMTKGDKETPQYKSFMERAKTFDETRDAMKIEIKEDKEFRKEFREKAREEFKEAIEQQREERKDIIERMEEAREIMKQQLETLPPEVRARLMESTNLSAEALDQAMKQYVEQIEKLPSIIEQESSGEVEASSSTTVTKKMTKVRVHTKHNLSDVKEEDTVLFQATAEYSDGTTKDVTNEAEWTTLGGIGSVERPGVFRAKLDMDKREQGEAPGAVGIRVKNEYGVLEGGAQFNVKTYINEGILDIGGQ